MNLSKQEFLNCGESAKYITGARKSERSAQLASEVEEFMAKKKEESIKTTFEDGVNLMLFACYASKPFTVTDVKEAVFDFHRATIYSMLQKFVEWNYLERISDSHYKATQYAKDIMNCQIEVVP